jgi:hypothetical protein
LLHILARLPINVAIRFVTASHENHSNNLYQLESIRMSDTTSSEQRAAIARAFKSPSGFLPNVVSPRNAAARQNHRLANGSFQNM